MTRQRDRTPNLYDLRAEIENATDRLDRIEPLIYTAIAAAAGIGFMVGIFAKQVAHVLFGA